MKVVSLALPLPLFREFSYLVPPSWIDRVKVGSLVEVEFHKRRLIGLVHAFEEKDTHELKPIIRVVPVSPWMEKRIALVEKLAQMYFAPFGEVASLFFPPLLRSLWPLLERRAFLVRDLPGWNGFPPGGMNLFLFRETFGLSASSLRKLFRDGIFRTEEEDWQPREVIFGERVFRFWRIALREERMEWFKGLIANASGERKKALLIFPDFQSLDTFEVFLRSEFPEKQIVKYDSRLSATRRMVVYRLVEESQYEIILGTRLALFLPIPDVYLYVLFDPEAQGHYSEKTPHYHALQILYENVQQRGGTLHVVGVVPSLWIYHRLCRGEFQEGDFGHSRLVRTKKVKTIALEKKRQQPAIAPSVRESIARALARGEKVLVWVQKTGYAAALGCRDCGFYYLCSDCEVALRYHLDFKILFCPLCGKKVKPDDVCPRCRGTFWEGWGEGIEKIYEELQKYFPKNRLLRVDSESPWKESPKEILEFPGIVVGTSGMLKEDLLRGSALLVVLSFEDWLYLSDFNARDEFYGELHRALWLMGTDAQSTPQVLIQGSSEAIARVARFLKPWRTFYGESLQKRKALCYPPFFCLVRVMGESRNKNRCILVLNSLRSIMEENGVGVTGPFPGAGLRRRGKWTEELDFNFEEERLKEVFELFSCWMVSVERERIQWRFEVYR
ncbi:MAG: hypothetical protein ABDK94_00295 [Atribacterota bacterium]